MRVQFRVLNEIKRIFQNNVFIQSNEVNLLKKYKDIIDNSDEGKIIINNDGKVDYFNVTFIN